MEKNNLIGNIVGFAKNRRVFINGKYLSPKYSQSVFNHSPDGFNWGYSGSGPSQLALAIMLKFTEKTTAQRLYQDFKSQFIAGLKQDENFALTIETVKDWIRRNA